MGPQPRRQRLPFGSGWPWSTRETRARDEIEACVEACGYRRQGVDQAPPDAVTAVAIAKWFVKARNARGFSTCEGLGGEGPLGGARNVGVDGVRVVPARARRGTRLHPRRRRGGTTPRSFERGRNGGAPPLFLAPEEGLGDRRLRRALAFSTGGFDEACREFTRVPGVLSQGANPEKLLRGIALTGYDADELDGLGEVRRVASRRRPRRGTA